MKRLTAAAFLFCASTAVLAQTHAPGTVSTDTAAPATRFMNEQAQGQWLVGNLWSKKVYDTAGKHIGDLNDVLVDGNGKVVALIVGVGGFLGIGEKNIAVDYDYVRQTGAIKSDRVILDVNDQQLISAPDFKRLRGA